MNEEGRPHSTVLDNSFDTSSVTRKLKAIKSSKSSGAIKHCSEAKKIVSSATKIGSRPLHGVKLLVKMAIIRSRGEAMIRHPVTPAALHPNAIHVVMH